MLDMNGRAVRIDNQCRTSMRNVWAIGDLAGEPMLAHRAMAQGEMVAEIIAGKRRHFTPAAIPAVCFTDPEVVVVGMTPQEAQAAGLDCISASFPFAANGRAMTIEVTDGFVRVVARKDNHLIVGWQAVGARGVGTEHGLRAVDRDGRAAGGCGRHDPCASDPGRGGAGSGAAGAGARAAYLNILVLYAHPSL
jgi:pyruvate/2-oxoglutarate dehydrogenase complex dihydrolipoamide dehydrogenase (E3) component